MEKKRDPRDDKLIRELYEKLDWYTFQAKEEEFDAEQVQMILKLLDSLDPSQEKGERGRFTLLHKGDPIPKVLPAADARKPAKNAEEAFERFKKKYNITDEDIARKNAMPPSGNPVGDDKIVPFRTEASDELAFSDEEIKRMLEATGGSSERKNGFPQAQGSECAIHNFAGQRAAGAETEMSGAESGSGNKKRHARFLSGTWGKVVIAFVVALGTLGAFSIGTSAVKGKSFLEIFQNDDNSMRIIVTGNEMENERESVEYGEKDVVYYDSWEEIIDKNKEIMIPRYIPDGLSLEELSQWDMENFVLYKGAYSTLNTGDWLVISISYFENEYADLELVNVDGWNLIENDEKDGVKKYQCDERYKALWKKGKCIYRVEWIDLNDIDKIVNNMR